MKPSQMRRKKAVDAARDFVYGKIKQMPQHFDERQQSIFNKYIEKIAVQKEWFDHVDNEMWLAYTGVTGEEYEDQIHLQQTLTSRPPLL